MDESNGQVPAPRWRHTSNTIDDNRMLVWGGIGEKSRFNDTYILQIDDETCVWTEQKPAGTPPAPRSYHTSTMIGNRIYMLGGYGGHGQRRQHFDDVHVLDLDLNAWLGQEQGFEVNREGGLRTEGTPPAPRGNHTTNLI